MNFPEFAKEKNQYDKVCDCISRLLATDPKDTISQYVLSNKLDHELSKYIKHLGSTHETIN